ncbi:MAG: flavin reductase (DIM6/NTAB) family NADH-FMN oxidoreductase RutF [Gammaproteobacteria bacterium]|jgi:flavin reductase (DIM6/NTAB) family NADH-FMN oxidoreductase RutF
MSESTHPVFVPRELRRAFGSFATGVTIVTTLDENSVACGFTANSFTSVSIEPPLLLVSIAKSAFGCRVFTESNGFAVNILAQEQRELSNRFASSGEDKFAGVGWRSENTGSPVIEDVVAWFDCSHHQQIDAGDHILLVGRVECFDYSSSTPLGFCRGAYMSVGLSPKILDLVSTSQQLQIGAIVEGAGSILLAFDVDSGEVSLPIANETGDRLTGTGLLGLLWTVGISIELSFIYSVYESGDHRNVYYLSELDSISDVTETESLRFVEFDQIPWNLIPDSAISIMLKRFIRERKVGNHAIYVGDHHQGEIFPA